MKLSSNFELREFERVSSGALNTDHIEAARILAQTILQPVRDQFGPVCVTSFLRTHSTGSQHAAGRAVDFVPCSRDRNLMARMHTYIATELQPAFGRNLLEIDHIHVTLPPDRGAVGASFVEVGKDSSGKAIFRAGYIAEKPRLASFVLFAALVGALIYAMQK